MLVNARSACNTILASVTSDTSLSGLFFMISSVHSSIMCGSNDFRYAKAAVGLSPSNRKTATGHNLLGNPMICSMKHRNLLMDLDARLRCREVRLLDGMRGTHISLHVSNSSYWPMACFSSFPSAASTIANALPFLAPLGSSMASNSIFRSRSSRFLLLLSRVLSMSCEIGSTTWRSINNRGKGSEATHDVAVRI